MASTIIKGRCPEQRTLLKNPVSDIPSYDVTFEIVEDTSVGVEDKEVKVETVDNSDGVEDKKVEGKNEINRAGVENKEVKCKIKAHKVILAAFSPVFKSMFFGPMKETKNVVQVEQTTHEAFKKLIEYIYQVDIECKNMTLLELYDMVNLAELYDMPQLMDELKVQMGNIPLTMDNLIDIAQTATQFEHFQDVTSSFLLTCAKFLKKSTNSFKEVFEFASNQIGGGREKTSLLLIAMLKDLSPLTCANCGEWTCLEGQEVPREKMAVGLKIRVNRQNRYWRKFVVPDRWTVLGFVDNSCEIRVQEKWGNCCEHYSQYNGSTFLFDCDID